MDWFERMEKFPAVDVLCALKDDEDRYWFGTAEGLYYFNPNTDSLQLMDMHNPVFEGISENMTFCLFQASQGNIWVGTSSGLKLFDPETLLFKANIANGDSHSISSNSVNAITEDLDGRLWIGTSQGGLDLFDNAKTQPTEGHFTNVHRGSVMDLLVTKNNSLWLGEHETKGLTIIDLNTFTKKSIDKNTFKHSQLNPQSLSDNSIYSLFEDKTGDIWIGTYGKGVNRFSPRHKHFHTFRQRAEQFNTLGSNDVNCFLEEEAYLWIGTEAGLNRVDKTTGEYRLFWHESDNPNSIGANAVYEIYKDSRGSLWIGTWAGGLNRYNFKEENFTPYKVNSTEGISVSCNNIFSLLEDPNGYMWIGTIGGGLNRYEYTTGKFEYFYQDFDDSSSLHDNYVNAIYRSQDGSLWISTYNTLNKYDPNTESFKYYPREMYQAGGMSKADLIDIFEDSRNNLWLCTEGGLVHFNREKEEFTQYTPSDGLPNRSIKAILEDDSGNLWLSTNKGLSKFIWGIYIPDSAEFRNYNAKDGIQGNEFIKRSAYKNKEGKLYFGGTNGYTWFYPDSIRDNELIPPIVITEFLVLNKDVEAFSSGNYLKKDISLTQHITLTHKESVISFRYAALNYLNPEKNKYKYILENFETEWNEVGNRRIATYTNLSAGDYTFRITGSNNDGIWNEQGHPFN